MQKDHGTPDHLLRLTFAETPPLQAPETGAPFDLILRCNCGYAVVLHDWSLYAINVLAAHHDGQLHDWTLLDPNPDVFGLG